MADTQGHSGGHNRTRGGYYIRRHRHEACRGGETANTNLTAKAPRSLPAQREISPLEVREHSRQWQWWWRRRRKEEEEEEEQAHVRLGAEGGGTKFTLFYFVPERKLEDGWGHVMHNNALALSVHYLKINTLCAHTKAFLFKLHFCSVLMHV